MATAMAAQPAGSTAPRNQIIAALPAEELAQLMAVLETVEMALKQPLFEPNKPIDCVYFPEDSVISILMVMEDGAAVEVATVGNEGVVGVPVFLGAERTPSLAFVQVAGRALRMSAADFRAAAVPGTRFHHVLSRYTQALFVQLAQSVACNRLHTIEQRCARWMLMTADRIGRDHFSLTQEFLAQMLGVRRASVNEVSRKLMQMGLIEYTRGSVTIVDRRGMEATSCECYGIVKAEYDRLAPQV